MEKEISRKSIFLSAWESKIGYSLNYKDFNELETIIDYYETQLKKQKEIIDKITSNIKNDIDGFMTINDHGECNDILDLLNIYLDILKEK